MERRRVGGVGLVLGSVRTAVNVEGDLMVVAAVNHWEGNDAEDDEEDGS